MDEFNNQNVNPESQPEENITADAVQQTSAEAQTNTNSEYEQRPSQKYGRTAYQQQMQEQQRQYEGVRYEQSNQQYGSNPYGQPNQQYGSNSYGQPNQQYGSNPYGQPNQQYGSNPYQQPNQQYGGNQYQQPYWNQGATQPAHGTVKDIFCYIVLIATLLGTVTSYFSLKFEIDIINAMSTTNMYSAIEDLTSSPGYSVLSACANILTLATIVFVVLDIIQIQKANYKITGLILFAIFLRPAYWIWRAHVLGQKKTVPIIYAIVVYGIQFVQFIWAFVQIYSAMWDIMMPLMY